VDGDLRGWVLGFRPQTSDPRPVSSPFFEDHRDGGDDQGEAGEVIPTQRLFQVEHGERGEDGESNYFLDGLELGGRKLVRADAVGRDLEAVFEEGDQPADQDHFVEWDFAELQVSVPGEGHENVGDG